VKTYKTEGIILKRLDFGEADRILTIFTKHYGKIKIIAKGVRKTTSRKGPSLELFNQVVIFVARGKSLDIVTETEAINSFPALKKDLKKVGLAYQACELVDKLTAERAENRQVFDLLKDYLSSFSFTSTSNLEPPARLARQQLRSSGRAVANRVRRTSNDFALSLLQLLGFWPKDKPIGDTDLGRYVESLIEKKLKSKRFLVGLTNQ